MRWLTLTSAVLLISSLASLAPATAVPQDQLKRSGVVFKVNNMQELGASRQVHGYRIDPACKASTAVLLQHGLSYTGEAWDIPGYSYARKIAAAGYTVVAIDRLGYGRSRLLNGYKIGSEAYAHMTRQIVRQLRKEGFKHVVLGGHSAGAEVSELAAGLFGGVDALMVMGYHHRPGTAFLKGFIGRDTVGAFTNDYVYFLGTPRHRAEMFYTANADPAVVAADTKAAVPTPSGEILTIGNQPSRLVMSKVKVPVFLQLAEQDRLFPIRFAKTEKALFLSASSVTLDTVPAAGHTYITHRSGPAAADRMTAWLRSLKSTPACNASHG
ncbi:MAG: alpha/beta hydrolase [Egibacteraceae bacterium]